MAHTEGDGERRPEQVPVSMTPSGHEDRGVLLERVGEARGSKAMLYVTGDRPGLELLIGPEADDVFVEHLESLWPAKKISLILYTLGGSTAAAWRLANLLRIFCDELEVIVLAKALSAGTLMCLGANRIIMSKQSTLGPIDPSVTGPLTPRVPGTDSKQGVSVSAEAVQGYLDMIKDVGIEDSGDLATVLKQLSTQIHPLVLGQIFRVRAQIRNLARNLLVHQGIESPENEKIIDFLCSESGSHDHKINRREAGNLGLKVEKPSEGLYEILKALHENVRDTLLLREKFSNKSLLRRNVEVRYRLRRGLIETASHGSHQYVSEGMLSRSEAHDDDGRKLPVIQNVRMIDEWQKEDHK